MIQRLGAWIPAAAWAAFLFLLSTRESLPVDVPTGFDKVAHFAAYCVLGLLLSRAAASMRGGLFLAAALGWLYGATDELHQSTVPGRDASFGDWVADAAGTVTGILLYLLILRLRSAGPPRVGDEAPETTSS